MNIYYKQIECITIIGNQDEANDAFEFCAKNGLHIVRAGPKPIGNRQYDTSKFKIVAEKECRS